MNYLDYFPVDQRRAGQLQGLSGGLWAQWATGYFRDQWGHPVGWPGNATPETFGIGNCGGEQWLTLLYLGSHKIKTLRAIVTRDGVAQEITCDAGHPYALLYFVPHSIEVWALVADLKCYWKARYEQVDERNPILNESRPCIVQSEVWGNDDYAGKWSWTRGGPQPPTAIPFNAAGQPIPIATESAWFQGIGRDYGPAWVMGEIKDGARVVTSAANSHGWAW